MTLNNKKILIIKPSSLGDIIHTLPLVHAIKRSFPESSLGWVVQKSFADILHKIPNIDTVHSIHIPSTSDPSAGRGAYLQAFKALITSLHTLRSQFRKAPYDLILDLQGSFRSGLLGWTNPGGIRIGFEDAKELNTFFQKELVVVPEDVHHALDKNLLFCKHLHIKTAPEDFTMGIRPDLVEVQSFLKRNSLTTDSQLIYANPAARWESKFWPIQHWAQLADLFFEKGITMVFGGSKQDVTYIQSITDLMQTEPVVAAGKFSLPQSISLIQQSSLYVGLDSGPMHIASLAGIPVVALFGPTHPSRVGPYGVRHHIVRAEGLDCLECRKRHCSHLSCMTGISTEKVYTAAMSLLDRN